MKLSYVCFDSSDSFLLRPLELCLSGSYLLGAQSTVLQVHCQHILFELCFGVLHSLGVRSTAQQVEVHDGMSDPLFSISCSGFRHGLCAVACAHSVCDEQPCKSNCSLVSAVILNLRSLWDMFVMASTHSTCDGQPFRSKWRMKRGKSRMIQR